MNQLIEAALEVQSHLDEQHVRFCLIGGFAAHLHAEPRVTRDIDISVLTGLGNEESILDVLLEKFRRYTPSKLDLDYVRSRLEPLV